MTITVDTTQFLLIGFTTTGIAFGIILLLSQIINKIYLAVKDWIFVYKEIKRHEPNKKLIEEHIKRFKERRKKSSSNREKVFCTIRILQFKIFKNFF